MLQRAVDGGPAAGHVPLRRTDRAGDLLSPSEATALLRALDEADFAGHCPHGRPVVLRYSVKDIQRAFKRI